MKESNGLCTENQSHVFYMWRRFGLKTLNRARVPSNPHKLKHEAENHSSGNSEEKLTKQVNGVQATNQAGQAKRSVKAANTLTQIGTQEQKHNR